MTLHRNKSGGGMIEFTCDGCDDLLSSSDDFDEAREELKAEGWSTRRDSTGEWVHYCPTCKDQRYG